MQLRGNYDHTTVLRSEVSDCGRYANQLVIFLELGNPRGNENPFLLSFGIMWFRYHNVIAERLKLHTNETDDEKLYNEARKWVIGTHQVSM